MNIQELIRKYEELLEEHSPFHEPVPYTSMVELFLKDLKQLDEPQKVKVSEEEAKFLETFDFDRCSDITKALYYVSRAGWGHLITDNNNVEMKDLTEDVVLFVKNRKRLIKAILFGYEVEKEPKYIVKFKGLGHEFRVLKYNIFYNDWFTGSDRKDSSFKLRHTRKELEDAGFGWVFNCEGIEIEEVE